MSRRRSKRRGRPGLTISRRAGNPSNQYYMEQPTVAPRINFRIGFTPCGRSSPRAKPCQLNASKSLGELARRSSGSVKIRVLFYVETGVVLRKVR
jgi:hypothetical protein